MAELELQVMQAIKGSSDPSGVATTCFICNLLRW